MFLDHKIEPRCHDTHPVHDQQQNSTSQFIIINLILWRQYPHTTLYYQVSIPLEYFMSENQLILRTIHH